MLRLKKPIMFVLYSAMAITMIMLFTLQIIFWDKEQGKLELKSVIPLCYKWYKEV